jgi:hypothetical protein
MRDHVGSAGDVGGATRTDDPEGFQMTTGTQSREWLEYDYPSTAVVELVAEATGRQQEDLPPLYDHVDSDALDSLLTGASSSRLELSFVYGGVSVRVTGAGAVEVESLGPRATGSEGARTAEGCTSPD